MRKLSQDSRSLIGIVPLLFFFACSSLPCQKASQEGGSKLNKFQQIQAIQPDLIWARNLKAKTQKALVDYVLGKTLPDGSHYGDSVRNFSLSQKTASEIDTAMQGLHCDRKEDFLKKPDTQAAVVDSDGKKIPMTLYLCPDGGVVRVKPIGDPTSKFRPQPHASKSLRFPYNAKFESFEDEVVKVDNRGRAVPKWTKDLNPVLQSDPTIAKEMVQGWADDAHTDILVQ